MCRAAAAIQPIRPFAHTVWKPIGVSLRQERTKERQKERKQARKQERKKERKEGRKKERKKQIKPYLEALGDQHHVLARHRGRLRQPITLLGQVVSVHNQHVLDVSPHPTVRGVNEAGNELIDACNGFSVSKIQAATNRATEEEQTTKYLQ